MLSRDYAKAREIIFELGKIEPYKARSLRSLGILETEFDIDNAIILFKEAFDLGDKKSFSLYLNALAIVGRFDELLPYYDDIYIGALHDQSILETFCLITEYLNLEKNIKPFLRIARRAPLEITVGNLCLVRLLMRYGEAQDKLATDFLNRELFCLKNSRIKAIPPVREFHLPDKTTIENYQNTDEYKYYQIFINEKRNDAWGAISKLLVLAVNPQYQMLVNSDLAFIAIREKDLLRAEQLSEISLKIGDAKMIYPLFTSLIVQKKLDKAKKYELAFFDYTFSNKNWIEPETFVKYCLLSNNKEMFLKWVRSASRELMLNKLGTKNIILEGLDKWGQNSDTSLVYYLKTNQPRTNNKIDWSAAWGIPHNGKLLRVPKWDGPSPKLKTDEKQGQN
jgi:hypothetical protein